MVEWAAEIVGYEKPTLYAMRISSDEFTTDVRYRLEETDRGTRLEYYSELEMRAGNALTRLLSRMAAHHNKRERRALKALAEQASQG